MENTTTAIQEQNNSNLSIALILVNVLLVLIFINTGNIREGEMEVNLAFAVWSSTILVGIYTFSYHGKGYRIAKWIFTGLLLLSIALIALFVYVVGLSHAFKN